MISIVSTIMPDMNLTNSMAGTDEGGKLKQNAMVTYKDPILKLAGHCGLVEDLVPEKPNVVWVRWLGDMSRKRENVRDLEEI